MKKHIFLKSSLLALVAGASFLSIQAAADQVDVQVLGVNDFHGALDTTGTASMPDGPVRDAGGVAQLDAYMDDAQTQFQAEHPQGDTTRVQAGDMVGASPANSGLLQDEPTVKAFNQMDVQFGTIGNHEFDEGLAEYNRIVQGQAPEPGKFDPIVDQYSADGQQEAAKQQILAANIIDQKTNQIPFGWQPYAIKTIPINGKKVKMGYIGIVTTEIPNLVLRKNLEGYTFLDEAETIAKYAKELNDQGVHAIGVLAHVAADNDAGELEGDAVPILNKLNQIYPDNSVDIFFAGHSHKYANGVVGRTRVVQATSQGKAFEDVRGVLDTDTGDFTDIPSAQIIPVAPGKAGSPDLQAIVDDASRRVKTVTQAKIGTATFPQAITRETNQDKETAVGDLVTQGQLTIARKTYPDVDFALTNNGGVRSDLIVNPDKSITWGAAQAVQPFGNVLQVVQLTGQQIYDALNQQYDEQQRYFFQMAGLHYLYTDNPAGGKETPYKVVKAYKDDGSEIDPNQTYKVVINDFLYGGGDGFSVLRNAPLIGAIDPDTETFVQYIKDQEAAGKTVDIPEMNHKTYVTVQTAHTYQDRPDGRHLLTIETYVNRQGQPVGQAIISDQLIKENQSEARAQRETQDLPSASFNLTPLADKTGNQSTAAQAKQVKRTEAKSLPETGTEEKSATALSLVGLIMTFTVFFTGKKKEEN
ncbi:5'-nucleotidase [Streptococcus criceti]|uniref:5'-nucleotidase family protein n=1 Tax=Streptococcus criceti HS-6 TaxID=873449 RepID=G5JPI7_STRCG|nr:bifunctional metallophosphatase/5'-nucleotidase [Streptococcus criceti]EHI75536.1 5'-nucleotidase family protein [Streptococcus criceti HS-6]SUN43246.1 5'-nucleotidase [Streptococcus criceti]